MYLIKHFWYLIHVEQQRNGNSADVIDLIKHFWYLVHVEGQKEMVTV